MNEVDYLFILFALLTCFLSCWVCVYIWYINYMWRLHIIRRYPFLELMLTKDKL